LERAVAHLAAVDLQFRRDLAVRMPPTDGEAGMRLARIAGETGSEEAAIALLSKPDLRPFESILMGLVGGLLETKAAAGEGTGYYLVPRDATELKRRLAAVLRQGPPNDVVGSRLLAMVRERRVEHGLPQSEPLHPDIEQLQTVTTPWPLLT